MNEDLRYPEPPAAPDELHDAVDSLAPADAFDPVIEAYKKDVDRTLLRENLKLSPQQRSEKFLNFMKNIHELHRVAAKDRAK